MQNYKGLFEVGGFKSGNAHTVSNKKKYGKEIHLHMFKVFVKKILALI